MTKDEAAEIRDIVNAMLNRASTLYNAQREFDDTRNKLEKYLWVLQNQKENHGKEKQQEEE